MAIRIPSDAKVIQDKNLTLIRVIKTLNDRLVDRLVAKVKETMKSKDAQFAHSDFVVAALRAGSAKSTIDARKLYKLVEAGQLKLQQFLECVTVLKTPLEQYLSGDAIEKISAQGPAPDPSLVTEFKPGVELDLDQLADELIQAVSKSVPITL